MYVVYRIRHDKSKILKYSVDAFLDLMRISILTIPKYSELFEKIIMGSLKF